MVEQHLWGGGGKGNLIYSLHCVVCLVHYCQYVSLCIVHTGIFIFSQCSSFSIMYIKHTNEHWTSPAFFTCVLFLISYGQFHTPTFKMVPIKSLNYENTGGVVICGALTFNRSLWVLQSYCLCIYTLVCTRMLQHNFKTDLAVSGILRKRCVPDLGVPWAPGWRME